MLRMLRPLPMMMPLVLPLLLGLSACVDEDKEDYLTRYCTCASCSDDQEELVRDSLRYWDSFTTQQGCGDQWTAWMECAAGRSKCDDGEFTLDCEEELESLEKCTDYAGFDLTAGLVEAHSSAKPDAAGDGTNADDGKDKTPASDGGDDAAAATGGGGAGG
jgi:hypothetical protein